MAWVRKGMRGAVIGWIALVAGSSGCQTPLPSWDPPANGADGGAEGDAAGEPHLRFDPPSAADAVTRITRIEVELGRPIASPRVLLVEGALTSGQLRELARPAISQALSARVQRSVVWTSSP